MATTLRQPTLETLGLGSVLDMFRRGSLPVTAKAAVRRVFGTEGSMLITGAQGIVGAGKMMQLGSRLLDFGIPMVGLDMPGTQNGIQQQYPGLVRTFGRERADMVMDNITLFNYNGKSLPCQLGRFNPRVVLEAIPEVLDLKREHYAMLRDSFPEIDIRSVTSGFPSSQLGVGVCHPAFPHQSNKVWEVVESEPSAWTQMLWALGLIPIPVSDNWSFVLDVLFCGVTHAALRYHEATNMPFWKVDKLVRMHLGANPLRAHDAIGAKGANFLTWSCLQHLAQTYGPLFEPTATLVERKMSGQDWYHSRPSVDWTLDQGDHQVFRTWLLGPLMQMTSIMLGEERAHLSHLNAIGELCAQFRQGILAVMRQMGTDEVNRIIRLNHTLAQENRWTPHTLNQDMSGSAWQQLYVNAEHDGTVGVITISRESLNGDVIAELNRAMDWLKAADISKVIVTSDFHLSTQMVGADISEFFPALTDAHVGEGISRSWSQTARRLGEKFFSVGVIPGKRCLGGFLELMLHCDYIFAVADAQLGFPEVTLPVVPGMEGCHLPFRRTASEHWPKLLHLLLSGKPVKAVDAVGWLIDGADSLDKVLQIAWGLVTTGEKQTPQRVACPLPLVGIPHDVPGLSASAAQRAIMQSIISSCKVDYDLALSIQARHSADFMTTPDCHKGRVGQERDKVMVS